MLGIELESLEEQPMLLIIKSSLQSISEDFLKVLFMVLISSLLLLGSVSLLCMVSIILSLLSFVVQPVHDLSCWTYYVHLKFLYIRFYKC